MSRTAGLLDAPGVLHFTSKTTRRTGRLAGCAAAAMLFATVTATRADALVTPNATSGAKQTCAYSSNSISALGSFESAVGIPSVNCSEVYDYVQTWSAWDNPWFLGGNPDGNWASWVNSAPSGQPRQLIISAPLIPTVENSDPNWRSEGAAGQFNGYATQLATNLVHAGLQNSIIVLAAEANGTWDADNIGTTTQNNQDWVSTWRNEVLAMRAVPGANFTFVWTVNNRVPDVPFTSYYPGDDVVNVIGDDVYDNANGWSWAYGGDVGLGSLIGFANAHGKPLAFPEWGTGAPTASNPTGDDPQFVQGIAQVVANQNVAFQTYFYKGSWQTQLTGGAQGFSVFRSAFAGAAAATSTVPTNAGATPGSASSAASAPPATTGTGATPARSTTTSTTAPARTSSTAAPPATTGSQTTKGTATKTSTARSSAAAAARSARTARRPRGHRSRRVGHPRSRRGGRTHRLARRRG